MASKSESDFAALSGGGSSDDDFAALSKKPDYVPKTKLDIYHEPDPAATSMFHVGEGLLPGISGRPMASGLAAVQQKIADPNSDIVQNYIMARASYDQARHKAEGDQPEWAKTAEDVVSRTPAYLVAGSAAPVVAGFEALSSSKFDPLNPTMKDAVSGGTDAAKSAAITYIGGKAIEGSARLIGNAVSRLGQAAKPALEDAIATMRSRALDAARANKARIFGEAAPKTAGLSPEASSQAQMASDSYKARVGSQSARDYQAHQAAVNLEQAGVGGTPEEIAARSNVMSGRSVQPNSIYGVKDIGSANRNIIRAQSGEKTNILLDKDLPGKWNETAPASSGEEVPLLQPHPQGTLPAESATSAEPGRIKRPIVQDAEEHVVYRDAIRPGDSIGGEIKATGRMPNESVSDYADWELATGKQGTSRSEDVDSLAKYLPRSNIVGGGISAVVNNASKYGLFGNPLKGAVSSFVGGAVEGLSPQEKAKMLQAIYARIAGGGLSPIAQESAQTLGSGTGRLVGGHFDKRQP